jgi:CBS domain-containing protein
MRTHASAHMSTHFCACVAAFGGITGAIFNHIVETLNHWRGHAVNKQLWSRVLEVVCLVIVTGTVSVFLPTLFECQHPTRSLLMEDSIGCLSEEDAYQISQGSISHDALTGLLGNCSANSKITEQLSNFRAPSEKWDDGEENKWKDVVWLDNGHEDKHIHLHYQHGFTCPEGDYNPMSMLWLNGGVKGVKVLLQRGFPHMLSWEVLVVFFCVYFLFAAYTSGVSVPAGLIVPHLLIGGSYGRAFGLLGIHQKKWMCSALSDLEDAAAAGALNYTYADDSRRMLGGNLDDPSDWMFEDTYFWSTVYRWIGRDCKLPDPGMYAVVGCAAFLSGSGRITMMLATVIIELTDDASLIGPVGVASIIAMIVGNLFNHGLYHGLIPVMNMPFLNSEPADVMNLVHVSDVMTREVICLSKLAKQDDVERLIKRCDAGNCSHNAFPVVDQETKGKLLGKKLRGIISLQNLRLALSCEKTAKSETNARKNRYLTGSDLNVKFRQPGLSKYQKDEIQSWLMNVNAMKELSVTVLHQIIDRMQTGDVPPL